MKTNTKRVFVIVGLLFACFVVTVSWSAFKAVAWARDLPNRVVIDVEPMANAFGQAVNDSYHLALRGSDETVQLQVLEDQFEPLIRESDEGAEWIRKEFHDDLSALVDSSNPEVSKAASNILSLLDGAK